MCYPLSRSFIDNLPLKWTARVSKSVLLSKIVLPQLCFSQSNDFGNDRKSLKKVKDNKGILYQHDVTEFSLGF